MLFDIPTSLVSRTNDATNVTMIISCYCTKEFAVYRRLAFSIIRLISPSLPLSLSHKSYLLHCRTFFLLLLLLLLPIRESTSFNRRINFSVMFRWYLRKVRRDIVDRTPPNSTPQFRLGGTGPRFLFPPILISLLHSSAQQHTHPRITWMMIKTHTMPRKMMPLGRTIRTSSQNHTVLYQSTS